MRMRRPRSRTSVVACGVDNHLFTPDGPAEAKSAMHRIVSVGRLVPRKGFDDMVRAMPSIPHAELVIVGGPKPTELHSDSEARRLRDLADELGVGSRVHLLGSVDIGHDADLRQGGRGPRPAGLRFECAVGMSRHVRRGGGGHGTCSTRTCLAMPG